MGLAHSRRQSNTAGAHCRYDLGYRAHELLSTAMAHQILAISSRFNHFTDPNRNYLDAGRDDLEFHTKVGKYR